MNPNAHFLSLLTTFGASKLAYMCDISYREALGSLMYAVMVTHLNIVFAVMLLLCFSSNPTPAHWEAVKQVF